MTTKQMYRMMRNHGISLVFVKRWNQWFAGDGDALPLERRGWLEVNACNPVVEGQYHFSDTPEEAVEDYCNARNLEWDN